MLDLRDKFRGCLLGAVVGDVAGAVVEAESPQFIAGRYRSVDQMLATESVAEFSGPEWRVGRFTDDTQMMLCVAEWLIADAASSPQKLLARFAASYEPWRRYGPSTETILRLFRQHPDHWRELATASLPEGSYGNGSAMRVAPVGLMYCSDVPKAAAVAIESSRPTHTHSLAYQGAVLQSAAVAAVTARTVPAPDPLLQLLRERLAYFSDLMQDTSKFNSALDLIEQGLRRDASCAEMSEELGTGVVAWEAVPMALYCFLRHPLSYERVIHEAIFIGGDTDTIAAMAGALSGAFLGKHAIPSRWLAAIREDHYTAATIEGIADRLFERCAHLRQ